MKNGILVASFGTTYKEAREISLRAIERTISLRFPGFAVYKAYTSSIVKKRIQENEGVFIPDVLQALQQMYEDGVENVYIQPTHMIPGEEYNKISDMAGQYKDMFNIIKVSVPLLSSYNDFEVVADILGCYYNFNETGKDKAIVLMGHGSGHDANKCYSQFQDVLIQKGFTDVFVSTVEGIPAFGDLLNELDKYKYKDITLIPFMVTAGDHAHNDMAGSSKDSWKNMLESIGYNITVVTHGIGELKEIQDIYSGHLESIVGSSI
ncbi:MAG: sirohydrochlorin cobaltochelatase [Lachnospiraceae bacterium]|nr:sirohydrochlorin cobaltochelatase [Lachnospiraceae bacterium]